MSRRFGVAATALGALILILTTGAGASTTVPAGKSYVAYCATTTPTSFQGCWVDGATAPVSIPAGSSVTTDPVVPTTATHTSGLTAPDGILGVIPPSKVNSGLDIPAGATTIMYIDKQVGFFLPGALVGSLKVPVPPGTIIPVTADYSGFGPGTYYVAANADLTRGPVAVTCTGATTTPMDELTGCSTSPTAPSETIPAGNDVGAPGACNTPGSVLQQIGEGSTKGKTLFKNNEDFAAVRMAWTTDGVHFTDVTPSGSGIQGLGNPTAQTGIRWVSPGGTVIENPDGSLGLFYSEGQCSDGDSDAFGSMEYATSTDGGLTWSTPQQIPDGDTAFGTGLLSTDYTYGASIYQAAHPGTALDVSAYYEGRIYSPSVVPHYDHSGHLTGLTMSFAGYRTSKPLPATGTGALPLGRSCATCLTAATSQYTPQATDPALYRNVLTVQLTPKTGTGTNPATNPTTYVAGVPVVAQVQNGPWTTAQGDPGANGTTGPYGPNGRIGAGGGGAPYTTFTTGGSPTNTFGGTVYPNMATYPGNGSSGGTAIPYTTGYAGTPGPLAGYCGHGGFGSFGPSTIPSREPAGWEPMSPYYFPHIEPNPDGGGLIGFFDYRPKDTDEAVVMATSQDDGAQWTVKGEALELSQGHCPEGNSDVAQQTTTDDGQGHAFDLSVNVDGKTEWILYTLNRSNGTLDTVNSQMLAHVLVPHAPNLGLPASEPVGTDASTVTTVSQTITNTPGGVSTSNFTVGSTSAFLEVPGRIYITVPS